MSGGSGLDRAAVALRPARVVGDELRLYTATTFPGDPWGGCDLALRRCRLVGGLARAGEQTGLILDVLDDEGDIIQDYALTRKGLRYLRRTLRFTVDHEPEEIAAAWRAGRLAAREGGEG